MTNFIRSVIFTLTLAFSLSFPAFCPTVFSQEVLNFGWTPPKEPPQVNEVWQSQLQELTKYGDEEDALIYRFLYRALKENDLLTQLEKDTGRLKSLDQMGTGSCVSFGATRALGVTAACDIYIRNEQERYKLLFNPNAIYGIIRTDHLGRWDGANGWMAAESLKKYGVLHQRVYGDIDLTNSTDKDARRWAATGLPQELYEYAKEHQVIASAVVKTVDEVKAAVQNGYGVILCANVSYHSVRDDQGFARRTPEGWAHCLALVGYRGPNSGREGFCIANSWGGPEGRWISGPIWPEDQPFGSFWITPENLQVHLKSGDCYAIAGYNGFKRRELRWDEIFDIGGEIEED